MDKKLLLGAGAVAAAGLIVGGWMMSSRDIEEKRMDQERESTISDEDRQKIEDLVWDQWKDKEKYQFCDGEVNIINEYSDSMLNNQGKLSLRSKELLLFDQESNKLYIIAREIVYKYNGQMSNPMGLSVNIPINEYGALNEAYRKNEMPIRIDYFGGYISTMPDTKKTGWVSVSIGDDHDTANPRAGCAGVYSLDPGAKMGESIFINKTCEEIDLEGKYEGNFTFYCNIIGYDQAKEKYETVKLREKIDNNIDLSIFDNKEDVVIDVDSATVARDGFKVDKEEDEYPKSDELKKLLEQMRDEIGASRSSQD